MNPFSPFGMPQFDPSKMDPQLLMEISQIFQQLPPEQLSRMQALMHNMMAGFNVQKDMEEFEKSLPPGFREKLLALMGRQAAQETSSSSAASAVPPVIEAASSPVGISSQDNSANMNVRDARLTILKAVATGSMSPEDAEKILFSA